MAFHVGQKVVCVNDTPKEGGLGLHGLTKDFIYTIRQIMVDPHPHPHGAGEVIIYLEEIIRPLHDYDEGIENGFDPCRFRPIVERGTETGMSILRGILDNVPDKVSA